MSIIWHLKLQCDLAYNGTIVVYIQDENNSTNERLFIGNISFDYKYLLDSNTLQLPTYTSLFDESPAVK